MDNPPCPALHRYRRQTALGMIGAEGQRKIGKATVLIAGCGALGSMQAGLAARAGVGRLILVDRDILEMHNLQRQTLYTEQDVRERLPKAVAAARHIQSINSEINIEHAVADLNPANILAFASQANLILDGTDNFETRYLLNDAAVHLSIPWVYGGVMGTQGTSMLIRPSQGPCLRCLFEEPPPASAAPREVQGVLATAVAWVAALQITQMLRILTGHAPAETLLHSMDIWNGRSVSALVVRDAHCTCCIQRRFEFLDAPHAAVIVAHHQNAVQFTPPHPAPRDLPRLAETLHSVCPVSFNGLLLECELATHKLILFPDGRTLVTGTTDPDEASRLVFQYLGGE